MTPEQKQAVKAILRDDAGFSLVVEVLKARRMARKISVQRLSRVTGLTVEAIGKIESGDLDFTRVKDLLLVAKALGYHAGVALVPKREKPPRGNSDILALFDKLLRSRKAVLFFKKQPDKELAHVYWDVLGDRDRNLLFVVCTNPKRNVRFGAVTAEPGYPIRSQWAGMDVETTRVMNRMSRRLLRKHREELL